MMSQRFIASAAHLAQKFKNIFKEKQPFKMKKTLIIASLMIISLLAFVQKDKFHDAFFEDFSTATSQYFTYGSTGHRADFKWKMGIDSPTNPDTDILSLKIDPEDSAGAGRGPEIISNDFTHFGTYATRLKVPDVKAIQPDAGAVVGYFTYHVDSIPGLSEIDFEWLIADPEIIYIGTWMGHSGKLQRIGRTINMASGQIYNTIYKEGHDGIGIPLAGEQNQPEAIPAIEGYDASSQFYTYGFDWHPDRLRWWMIHPVSADTVVLWDYQGQRGIPQHRSRYRMNFWHTDAWAVETNPASLEKPLRPYELEVDWMSYKPAKD